MAGRRLRATEIPTPGPWLVRGEAEPGASPLNLMLGIEPASDERPGGWPYLVRRRQPVEPSGLPASHRGRYKALGRCPAHRRRAGACRTTAGTTRGPGAREP